jgi:hypothetical protein
MIRNFFVTFLFILLNGFLVASAQDADKSISIIVSGSGKTQDDAKQSALRSAIEQAFGAFISSKTEMLNDKVISDQITSVANGNIQSYNILNEIQLPDGAWGVTLKASVSVSKLTSFVQAKGISVEVKGGLFAVNIKQQLLNETSEVKAVCEMVGILHEPMQIAFDYEINSGEPKALDVDSKNWEIPITVKAKANKNMDFCANYLIKTLTSLSLTAEEVTNYKGLNKPVFKLVLNYGNNPYEVYLRRANSLKAINTLCELWGFYTKSFKVESGLDESYGFDLATKGEYSYGTKDSYNKFTTKSYEFSSIARDPISNNYQPVQVNLLKEGMVAAIFTWNDKRTLAQIEKINEFKVKSAGIFSSFKEGGFVVGKSKKNNFILSLFDFGEGVSIDNVNEIALNGYQDWMVPTADIMVECSTWAEMLGFKMFYSKGGLVVSSGRFYNIRDSYIGSYTNYGTCYTCRNATPTLRPIRISKN